MTGEKVFINDVLDTVPKSDTVSKSGSVPFSVSMSFFGTASKI